MAKVTSIETYSPSNQVRIDRVQSRVRSVLEALPPLGNTPKRPSPLSANCVPTSTDSQSSAKIATAGVYSVCFAEQCLVGLRGRLPPVFAVCLVHPSLTVEYIRGSDRKVMRRYYDSLCVGDFLCSARFPAGGAFDADLGATIYLPRAMRALSTM